MTKKKIKQKNISFCYHKYLRISLPGNSIQASLVSNVPTKHFLAPVLFFFWGGGGEIEGGSLLKLLCIMQYVCLFKIRHERFLLQKYYLTFLTE